MSQSSETTPNCPNPRWSFKRLTMQDTSIRTRQLQRPSPRPRSKKRSRWWPPTSVIYVRTKPLAPADDTSESHRSMVRRHDRRANHRCPPTCINQLAKIIAATINTYHALLATIITALRSLGYDYRLWAWLLPSISTSPHYSY